MIWKYVSSSVTGKSHILRNEQGQDCCRAGTVGGNDQNIFIGLVADGAGSTPDGGTGAKIACDTLYRCISELIKGNGDLAAVSPENITDWIYQARESIGKEAAGSGKQIRDYACTLVGAIVGDHAVFFQVGDGAIVVSDDGVTYRTVFWPQQGEYSNTTFFISDDAFQESLMVAHQDTPPCEIALFTDGLQNLVLSYPAKSVHSGFFKPLFEFLKRNADNKYPCLSSQLDDFLNRDEINERNDDDKTLILAFSHADLK